MSRNVLYIIFVIVFFSGTLTSQNFFYKKFDESKLPSLEVYHAFQDSKGYMWFCTNQGISQYDGYEFTNFDVTDGIPRNTVFEAYEDCKGRIWFTSLSDDLCYYYGNKFHVYAYNDSLKKKITIDQRGVSKRTFFVDSLDNIYYSRYREKVVKVDDHGNAQWVEISANVKNVILKIRNDGCILNDFSVKDSVFYIQDVDERWIQLKERGFSFNSLTSKSLVTDSCIIITSYNKMLVVDRKLGEYEKYTFESNVIWLSEDSDGIVWVGLHQRGIKAFANSNFEHPIFHLLQEHSVSSICKDTEGGYWATTLDNGVCYFPCLKVKNFTQISGIKNKFVASIARKGNEICFAGNAPQVYSFDGDSLSTFYQFESSKMNIRNIGWINDQLMVSASLPRGMGFLINSIGKEVIELPFYCLKVVKKDNGKIICASGNHDYMAVENGVFNYRILPAEFRAKNIYDIYEDSLHALWYATERGLILEKNEQFIELAESNRLYGNRITCLAESNGELWMGTKGMGLLRKVRDSVYNYTIENGLPSNSISDIIIKDSIFWLATNRGIGKFVRVPKIENVEVWSTANGLVNNKVNDIELLNGYVYAGTQGGLSYFPQKMSGKNNTPPPIYINHVEINNSDTVLLNEYHLNYNQNLITFHFKGISYQKNIEIKYKYKLKGVDKTWNYSTLTEVRYSTLLPGKYVFTVLAINNSGVPSAIPVKIKIIISNPYWRTIWFWAVILISFFMFIILVILRGYHYRMGNLKKESFLKQEMNKYRQKALSAHMNPHFLYNSINSAQFFILNNNPVKASDYLSSLGCLMRIVLHNSMQETISLHEELDALFQYVEMEQLRFGNRFKFTKELSGDLNLHHINVPPLILQPYVENAIHHGLRAKEGEQILKLNIRSSNDIVIIIEDNGIGRDATFNANSLKYNQHRSLGTEITKHRLAILEEIHSTKMTVSIEDLYDGDIPVGTRVTLTITQ